MRTNRDPEREVVSAWNGPKVHVHCDHDDKITTFAASQLKERTAEELG